MASYGKLYPSYRFPSFYSNKSGFADVPSLVQRVAVPTCVKYQHQRSRRCSLFQFLLVPSSPPSLICSNHTEPKLHSDFLMRPLVFSPFSYSHPTPKSLYRLAYREGSIYAPLRPLWWVHAGAFESSSPSLRMLLLSMTATCVELILFSLLSLSILQCLYALKYFPS